MQRQSFIAFHYMPKACGTFWAVVGFLKAHPLFLLLSVMLYGIEHPLGQTGSTAQVMVPLSFLPIPRLRVEEVGKAKINK